MTNIPIMLTEVARRMKDMVMAGGDYSSQAVQRIGAVETGGGKYIKLGHLLEGVSAKEWNEAFVALDVLVKNKREGRCVSYGYIPTDESYGIFTRKGYGVVVQQEHLETGFSPTGVLTQAAQYIQQIKDARA